MFNPYYELSSHLNSYFSLSEEPKQEKETKMSRFKRFCREEAGSRLGGLVLSGSFVFGSIVSSLVETGAQMRAKKSWEERKKQINVFFLKNCGHDLSLLSIGIIALLSPLKAANNASVLAKRYQGYQNVEAALLPPQFEQAMSPFYGLSKGVRSFSAIPLEAGKMLNKTSRKDSWQEIKFLAKESAGYFYHGIRGIKAAEEDSRKIVGIEKIYFEDADEEI